MNASVLIGIQLALALLDGVANATITITKMNVAINAARAEGREITIEELNAIADSNRALTTEVLSLLRGSE
ncbi:MAG: hypothetical protein V3S55_03890 [Nitrospiraceae bacterium]